MGSHAPTSAGTTKPPTGPMMRSRSQVDAEPPGASRMSSATPSQMKKKASVTTMSGTRVSTTDSPLTVPSPSPRSRVAATATIPNSSP